ncbi:hypothetical protein DRW07_12050 [Alteromonas sediminis]|uniref:DNA topoisomerase type IA zn finger domain-containing protein n=1 Tax=Alteromonas sediminis TaxID=2259342 RepID=A0A3N5Y009_9ALTE|nr:topoisomerase DNA-binding C4 zinc finger domain-containing protein [Alteromonas sediminis]RPJ66802.1 hypothetical protein DRW07_12050 [Alteromonas sediminis]
MVRGVDKTLFGSNGPGSGTPDCPKCGAPLTFKSSKRGPFYGCSNYPQCDFSKPLHDASVSILKQIEGVNCPQCHGDLAVKKGRFGLFIGCMNYPDCHFIGHLNNEEDTSVPCPSCKTGELFEKTNRFGKRFYTCSNYPKCRYVVNLPPVNRACPLCGWKILIKKGEKRMCPQRDCEYQEDDTGTK